MDREIGNVGKEGKGKGGGGGGGGYYYQGGDEGLGGDLGEANLLGGQHGDVRQRRKDGEKREEKVEEELEEEKGGRSWGGTRKIIFFGEGVDWHNRRAVM